MRLHSSLQGAPAKQVTGERKERLVDIRASLIAHFEATEAVEPGEGTLHHRRIASTATTSAFESWTSAAEIVLASGTPVRSTTTWRLVPNLLRFVGSLPVASPPRSWHAGTVQRRPRPVNPPRILQSLQERVMQALPHPGALPVAPAPPVRHATAATHLLGERLPWGSTFQDKDDAGSAARSAMLRGRPPLSLGGSDGKSGAMVVHDASLTSGVLMSPIYHTP
jgi:hypothetical protein